MSSPKGCVNHKHTGKAWFPITVPLLFCLFVAVPYHSACCAGVEDGLKGKLIVGYQGWFGCPGDDEANSLWPHWFHNGSARDQLSVEMLPALEQFKQEDLCTTGMRSNDGSPVRLYSAQNPNIVATHFKWMAEYGIDGAAVQRFVKPLELPAQLRRSDRVMVNARNGAEGAGRVFFISYDVSGADTQKVTARIRADWKHLTEDMKLTSSPAYLRSNGKPVLEIWGFGFKGRPGDPEEVLHLLQDLKAGRDGLQAVSLIGGVPTNWRTGGEDSRSEPQWAQVYRSFDVISPWTVGRFGDIPGVDNFVRTHVLPDIAETHRLGIGYMPVIFPGFSWSNLQSSRGNMQHAKFNQIPRRCGNFMWRQVHDLLSANVEMLYAAMFDEVDEGTALFPVESTESKLPKGSRIKPAFSNAGTRSRTASYSECENSTTSGTKDSCTTTLPSEASFISRSYISLSWAAC
jgi:hypothetical protein